jgi:leucyl/phenylalanyl-tRNA--protein transferase
VSSPVRSPEPPSGRPSRPETGLARVTVVRPSHAVEPPATRWIFPVPSPLEPAAGPVEQGRPEEVIGVGADLEPGTLLAAYRSGAFPMSGEKSLTAWWSPEPRGILPLAALRITRSLRRSAARYTIRINTAFEEVIAACGDKRRRGAWIDEDIQSAYVRLHHWGWAHSVEAWDDYGRLAGGLYGVAIGGLFAGESMFHRQTDASKVALIGLVEQLRAAGARLLDVQWATPHLRSLGAVEVSRAEYQDLLAEALMEPQPAVFGGSGAAAARRHEA